MAPTHCELCGRSRIEPSPSTWGDVQWCLNCQLKNVTYYRSDGERFGYPATWGDLIGVIPYHADPRELETQDAACGNKYSNCYYIFRAADGTVRRARMQAEDFIEPDAPAAKAVPAKVRPATLRSGIKSYHFWIVDLMPITNSQSDDDGKSSTARG